ncbi:hypothetical protein ACNKHW_03325 [Shigella flexneri]
MTIRCANYGRIRWILFAGAGIVPTSSPLGEWRETGVRTFYHVERFADCFKERGSAFHHPLAGRVCPSLSGKRLLAGFAADRHSDSPRCQ